MLFLEGQCEILFSGDSVVKSSVTFEFDLVRGWLLKALVADVKRVGRRVVRSSEAIFFIWI